MAQDHKNIVLMIADDLGLMLGCYGDPVVKTPNLDSLAEQGARFTNAYASTASCSGSRSTIYTGLHTHQTGQYGLQHGLHHFQTYDHIETTPRLFNNLGYHTGIVGKVHVGPQSVYPWTHYAPSMTRNVQMVAAEASRFLDAASDTGKPFHLTIGFRDPHRDSTRGGFGNDEADVQNIAVQRYGPEDVVVPNFISDVPELRSEMAEYYRSISRMDVGIGLILAELKARGLDDSTLVIFVSDNGAPFVNSKTTLFDAGVRLPLIIRQPGFQTGIVNPNMVSFLDILPTCLAWTDATDGSIKTEHSDRSPVRRGRSILPIMFERDFLPESKWRQHVFGSHTFHEVQNYWPTRFMRSRKFKYHRNIAWRLDFPFGTDLYCSMSWEGIRNGHASESAPQDTPELLIGRRKLSHYLYRGPEELFDMEADPEEIQNLAQMPEYRDVVTEMRARLEEEQFTTGDLWLYRDGVSAISTLWAQKQGLKLPDRLDFDFKKPANMYGPHWERPERDPDNVKMLGAG